VTQQYSIIAAAEQTLMNSGAPVAAGLAVGIAFVVAFSVFAQNLEQHKMYGHSDATPASWYFIENRMDNIKEQNPEAIVKKGIAPEIINTPLALVATSSEGRGHDEPGDPSPVLKDTSGISYSMYRAENGGNKTIALTIENNSPDDIAVFVFGIQGYVQITIPETGVTFEKGTVYRPVISDKYDVGKPPITSPYWILAGDSLTAYIQGDFDAERYSANMCYSYDLSDRTGSSNYCIPLSWP
jgi:hypothetical protein